MSVATIETIDRAVIYLVPGDLVVFGELIYKVESVDTQTHPWNVTLTVSHESQPGNTASMTWNHPGTSLRIIKK